MMEPKKKNHTVVATYPAVNINNILSQWIKLNVDLPVVLQKKSGYHHNK